MPTAAQPSYFGSTTTNLLLYTIKLDFYETHKFCLHSAWASTSSGKAVCMHLMITPSASRIEQLSYLRLENVWYGCVSRKPDNTLMCQHVLPQKSIWCKVKNDDKWINICQQYNLKKSSGYFWQWQIMSVASKPSAYLHISPAWCSTEHSTEQIKQCAEGCSSTLSLARFQTPGAVYNHLQSDNINHWDPERCFLYGMGQFTNWLTRPHTCICGVFWDGSTIQAAWWKLSKQ